MIKIESLSNNCEAYVNGSQLLLQGVLITPFELNSLEIKSGSLTYSVNEKELITVFAPEPPMPPKVDNLESGIESVPEEVVLKEEVAIKPKLSAKPTKTK